MRSFAFICRVGVPPACAIFSWSLGTNENKAALASEVPLGRLGLSEEVADGIVFIASDEARFITGHVLNVDGGHTAN
jgi:NAD(P)-dependent dehydrogenase (short-subunit alcohol dehydrogenase family)